MFYPIVGGSTIEGVLRVSWRVCGDFKFSSFNLGGWSSGGKELSPLFSMTGAFDGGIKVVLGTSSK